MSQGTPPTPEAVAEQIVALYETRARRLYDGAVDQLAHGLQAALLAERAGAPAALVVAALLHDVGHLLEDHAASREADGFHERLGARFLATWFPQAVVTPVALHVAAKRYLVATDPAYTAQLSIASPRFHQRLIDDEAMRIAATPASARHARLV